MTREIAVLWTRWHRRTHSPFNRMCSRLLPELYITWPDGGFMSWGHLLCTPLPLLRAALRGAGWPDRLFARREGRQG